LCGNVNKALVRAALRLGLNAMGISGQDGALLRARKLEGAHDLGFVGEIIAVDPTPLRVLIDAEYVSIVAPLALGDDLTTVYNVNADTAAGKIAAALAADAYVAITDVPRLRRNADPNSGMARATAAEIAELIRSGAISGGMIPKVEAALIAIEGGAQRAFIGGGVAERPVSGALAGDATEVFA
jgi:acetylglutamate kinase